MKTRIAEWLLLSKLNKHASIYTSSLFGNRSRSQNQLYYQIPWKFAWILILTTQLKMHSTCHVCGPLTFNPTYPITFPLFTIGPYFIKINLHHVQIQRQMSHLWLTSLNKSIKSVNECELSASIRYNPTKTQIPKLIS